MVPARAGVTKERIWVAELGLYLGHDRRVLRKFAKRQGLLRRATGHGLDKAWYVSAYGAQRIIAYIRALQGAAYMHGKQPLEQLAHRRELKLRKQLPIAIPPAATEDDRQRSACETS